MAGTMQFFERTQKERHDAEHLGKASEIQNFYENPDKDEKNIWVTWAPPLRDSKKKKHEGAAIQVYHKLRQGAQVDDVNSRYIASRIRIQSPMIREVLADNLKKQGLAFNDKHWADSEHPHSALFFCRDKIAEMARNNDDSTTRLHCKLLEEVIQTYLDEALEAFEVYERDEVVSCRFLWILFPIGRVFALKKVLGNYAGMRVKSMLWQTNVSHAGWERTLQRWVIHAEVIRFNGIYYGTSEWNVVVASFDGKVKLCDVNPWIVDLSKDLELRKKLVDRGKKVLEYQTPAYVQYASQGEPSNFAPSLTDGERLVVDTYMHCSEFRIFFTRLPAYDKYVPELGVAEAGNVGAESEAEETEGASQQQSLDGITAAFSRPTASDIRRNKEIMCNDEDNLIICMPILLAYSIRRGYWSNVVVENLLPVNLEVESFKKLVFDEKKKKILRVLSSRFIRSRRPYDDLIPDKGNSFLVLLSGAPGTGKTLMAESLADHLGRPLLRIMANHRNPASREARATGASILAIADKVAAAARAAAAAATQAGKEVVMRHEFEEKVQMASDWDGIVLFDEANFVVEKNSAAIGSNISVFLRYIEYFQGIVFLTTNAESSAINTALKSRVHIHFTFPELSAPMRAQVWKNFVERTPEAAKGLGDGEIERLSQWRMTGRDIKNVFNMARVWCEEQKVELNVTAIEELIPAVNAGVKKEGEEEDPLDLMA